MTPTGYPFAHQGKTYYLQKLTVGLKRQFADWCAVESLKEASRILSGKEYLAFRQEVAAGGIYWTATPSMAVATKLTTREGQVKLNRLMLGSVVDDLDDDQLWAMLTECDQQEDYKVAFDLAWESADPKAKKV